MGPQAAKKKASLAPVVKKKKKEGGKSSAIKAGIGAASHSCRGGKIAGRGGRKAELKQPPARHAAHAKVPGGGLPKNGTSLEGKREEGFRHSAGREVRCRKKSDP